MKINKFIVVKNFDHRCTFERGQVLVISKRDLHAGEYYFESKVFPKHLYITSRVLEKLIKEESILVLG